MADGFENEAELKTQILEALDSLDEEDLKDSDLIKTMNKIFNNKVGVDKAIFESLRKEYEKNHQTYLDMFKAIDEEIIQKSEIKI